MQKNIRKAQSPEELIPQTETALKLAIYVAERTEFIQLWDDSETLHFNKVARPLEKNNPAKYKWLSHLATLLEVIKNNKEEDWGEIPLEAIDLFLFDLGSIKGDHIGKRQTLEGQKKRLATACNELCFLGNIMWDNKIAIEKSQIFYESLRRPLNCQRKKSIPEHLGLYKSVEFVNKPDPF